jgi:hypothetical protein
MAKCHWTRVVERLHIALKHHVCQLKRPNIGETDWTLGLEHATIRDNIIFGSRFGLSNDGFDEARYDAVLEACALKRDLAIFEAGDLTGGCLERARGRLDCLPAWA